MYQLEYSFLIAGVSMYLFLNAILSGNILHKLDFDRKEGK